MKLRPKRMLFELPTADEIDALAIRSPRFEVRKFDFDRRHASADLNYTPCKGQIVLVLMSKEGIVLRRARASGEWSLPSGRIGTNEEPEKAAKRIAREECGLPLRNLELAGMYDVVWHHSDISIKRLHLVYSALTEEEFLEKDAGARTEVCFFKEIPKKVLEDEISRCALADCSEK